MWFDFQSRVYGFDGMLPRTLRDLTLRPGLVTDRYINGNRVLYYGPVGYFFMMGTVYLIIMSLLGIDFAEFMKAHQIEQAEQTANQAAFQQRITELTQEYTRILFFMLIPMMAISSKMFFRKSGLNFLEHSVLPFYTSGHFYWLSIASLFLIKWNRELYLPFLFLALQAFYYGFTFQNYFRYNSRIATFVKGMLVFLVGMLLFTVLITLLSFVYLILSPSTRKVIIPDS